MPADLLGNRHGQTSQNGFRRPRAVPGRPGLRRLAHGL